MLEIQTELDEFRSRVVAPLEEEIRTSLRVTFPEMQRTVATSAADASVASQVAHETQAQVQALADSTRETVERLGAELGAEQRDHAEAITNLMDMLERTATQEELTSGLDACTQEADARASTLEGALAGATDRLGVVEQEVERTLSQLTEQVEGRLSEIDGRLTASIDSLSSDTAAELSRLEGDGQAVRSDLSGKVEGVADDLLHKAGDLARRCAAIEETVGTVSSARARDDAVLKLTQNMQALDAKVENTAQVLHQKVELTAEEMDRQLDATVTNVDAKLTKGARDAAARAEQGTKQMQQDFAEEKGLLDSEVEKLKTMIERQEKRLLSSLTTTPRWCSQNSTARWPGSSRRSTSGSAKRRRRWSASSRRRSPKSATPTRGSMRWGFAWGRSLRS